MIHSKVLEEPKLLFGAESPYIDPKLGLLQSGPYGSDPGPHGTAVLLSVGAVGTPSALGKLRGFLMVLRRRISSGRDAADFPWIVDFPGVGRRSRLRIDIRLEEDKVEQIDPTEERAALSPESRLQRIENIVRVYETRVRSLIEVSGGHPPQLLLLPISEETMKSCRDPVLEQDRIVYQRRTMARTKRSVPGDFPLLDFHNVLKVIGIQHRVPVQVIRPSTLSFQGSELQDPATIAWNFCVASFYKATGTPWKLADLDDETCYVGIDFYVEVGAETNLRAAMAQVYVRTGESQVIRGKPFRWEKVGRQRSPLLSEEQSCDVLTDVLSLYERQRGKRARRVVVHKSSQFSDSERLGFEEAAKQTDKLDLVHIFSSSGVRLYHLRSDYPPLRGTLLHSDHGSDGFLYTVGFVKGYGTYPGSSAPWPLRFSCDRLDTNVELVASDILALTKLDWNNTNFSTAQPVTLSVAEKVGEILSESKARQLEPPQSYRYYM